MGGLLCAAEADWAATYDVLLEPVDEPFEPAYGIVQVWNPVRVAQVSQWQAEIVGEISATRLESLRAVRSEWRSPQDDEQAAHTEMHPGRIALRSVDGFPVLTGTPLGVNDPRREYQQIYSNAAARLTAVSRVLVSALTMPTAAHAPSLWSRIREWFCVDAMVRPALAVLALMVVLQNAVLLSRPVNDDVRFRALPPTKVTANTPDAADVVFRWKADVDMVSAERLLSTLPADLVASPDAGGNWRLRARDPTQREWLLNRLAESTLIESIEAP